MSAFTTREEARAAFYPKGIPEGAKSLCEDMRKNFADLAEQVVLHVPPGRYRAMVMSKLEEAAALTTKAYSHG